VLVTSPGGAEIPSSSESSGPGWPMPTPPVTPGPFGTLAVAASEVGAAAVGS
jgi:hypothetical protein